MMPTRVAGADGCRWGWICVTRSIAAPFEERVFLARSFAELVDRASDAAVLAVDIPIGLPASTRGAGRECDALARAFLGKRACCVFPVPPRGSIMQSDYRRACAAAAEASLPPRQISKQIFNLFPKIREVDALMTPELQRRVHECHPELSFAVMNGRRPLGEPKKNNGRPNPLGLDRRRSLLLAQGFCLDFLADRACRIGAGAGTDDFYDACACAWTAGRVFSGIAECLPAAPPRDAKGLRMEILA